MNRRRAILRHTIECGPHFSWDPKHPDDAPLTCACGWQGVSSQWEQHRRDVGAGAPSKALADEGFTRFGGFGRRVA